MLNIIGVIKVKEEVRKMGIEWWVINWKSSVFKLVLNSVMFGLSLVRSGIRINVLNVINSICVFCMVFFIVFFLS